MLVAFRADASISLGSGHVTRCAALAHALKQVGGRCVFLVASHVGDRTDWLRQQGFEVRFLPTHAAVCEAPAWQIDTAQDARETLLALSALSERPDWLVIDHYGIDGHWLELCRESVGRTLLIDDLGGRGLSVDALLDMGLQAHERQGHAPLQVNGRCLYGPRHALLAPAFAATSPLRAGARSGSRLLACMGGMDALDALGTVLSAWQQLPGPRPALDLVVGADSPNVGTLQQRCEQLEGVRLHVQTDDMAGLMARAAWFIGSAGGVSWERCASGLPALMGTTAANQAANLHTLADGRTGVDMGNWAEVSPERLATLLQRLLPRQRLAQRMASRARRLVDGHGALRVALHMSSHALRLRPAVLSDAPMAFVWRNEEATRRHSFDARPLALNDHLAWWARTLADPLRSLLIAQVGELPVGVIRLDQMHERCDDAALSLVSIYLDPRWVGLGLGAALLRAAQRWVADQATSQGLRAEISPDNAASIAAFESVGFARSVHSGSWVWPIRQNPCLTAHPNIL